MPVASEALLTDTLPEVLGAEAAPLPSETRRIAGGAPLIPGLHDAITTGTTVITTSNAFQCTESLRKTTTTFALLRILSQIVPPPRVDAIAVPQMAGVAARGAASDRKVFLLITMDAPRHNDSGVPSPNRDAVTDDN